MAVLPRSLVLACLALAGAGCSLWPGEGSLGGEGDEEEAAGAGDEGALPDFTPLTVEERYALVRFLQHADGSRTAILTVPKGQGSKVQERLAMLCTCDDREQSPASIESVSEGGGALLGDPQNADRKFGSVPEFKALEDLILVRGSEADITEVLQAFDLWYNGAPQIKIEATVFEVLDSEEFSRGITKIAENTPLFANTDGRTFVQELSGGFGAETGNLGGIFKLGFIDEEFELNALLTLLERDGLVDIRSSPSVVVRSGIPATIESLERVPYLKPEGNISISGTTSFKIDYNDVGVKLNVVPFLQGADTIHLVIYAEVSRLGRDVTVGLDAAGQPISAPTTTKRLATTQVHVRNGTKVVIGGLKIREGRINENKIPILGDAPLVGWLFSSRSDVEEETEIYFTITPSVKERPSIDPIGDIFDPFAEEGGL